MMYRKSQIGWIVVAFFMPFIVFLLLAYIFQWGDNPISLVLLLSIGGFLIILGLLFYQLTVEVHDGFILLKYGVGLIKIRFSIDSLEEAQTIKTPWYYGLGIRITPKGMLYNIHGLKAVQITYTYEDKHKSIMIGSKEPEELLKAIQEAFPK